MADHMDLIDAEEETELHAAEQQRKIRRCYVCGSTKHFCPTCPLRKQRQPRSNQASPLGRITGKAGEKPAPSRRERPNGKELSFLNPIRGKGEHGLVSDLVGETTKREYKTGLLVVLVTFKGFEKPWSILIESSHVEQLCSSPFP